MTDDAYYLKSEEKGLPARCPILDKCSRRMQSIYLLGYYDVDYSKDKDYEKFLLSEGVIKQEDLDNKIPLQGEFPSIIGGSNNIYFRDVCPEVNLFDRNHGMFFAKGYACVEGDWDNYRSEPKYLLKTCRHFSQCPEFSKYQYENALVKRIENLTELDEVKDFLINGDLSGALKLLERIIANDDKLESFGDHCVQLMAKHSTVKKQEVIGTESTEKIERGKAKIIQGIQIIIGEIKGIRSKGN